jgi:hypothetical protein
MTGLEVVGLGLAGYSIYKVLFMSRVLTAYCSVVSSGYYAMGVSTMQL